jgi:hypothetical protein
MQAQLPVQVQSSRSQAGRVEAAPLIGRTVLHHEQEDPLDRSLLREETALTR